MINVFVSYSHDNESILDNALIPMLEDLKKENISDFFYDRKLRTDGGLFDTIEFKMKECEVAIILLSESYYNSDNCKKEKDFLLYRKKLDGIYVLPIVVSNCNWQDDDSIKNNLLLNTDAKPLDFLSSDELNQEINKIKERIIFIAKDIEIIKTMKFSNAFNDVLQDTDVLKTSHRSKNTLLLSDVFIYPTLRKFVFDNDKDDEINSEKLFEDSKDEKVIFISGDSVSGKTSLLKKYVADLKNKYFIPFYFTSDDNFDGHIFNILEKKFRNQFEYAPSFDIKELLEKNKERIVICIDDFHIISNIKKLIEKINIFPKIICTVDLIYNLDYEIKDLKEIAIKYSIKELSPKQRNEMTKKWLTLDVEARSSNEIIQIKELDKKAEQIEIITGKSLNGGIMPAYPFLVLSVLSNVETLNRPLNQQMTSYGYCYEALIIIAFTKCGLKTDDQIGGAINFLSSFAYYLYKNNIYELSSYDFEKFLDDYEKQIALPFKKDVFLRKLEESRLVILTTMGNYRFDYKYIYYYFLAKYFSENLPESHEEIEKLCKNIHKDENAYIIIFFSHNSKSKELYETLLTEANSICVSIEEVSLTKDEMKFFDDSYKSLIDVVLPNKTHNYKAERNIRLENKHEEEYSSVSNNENEDFNDESIINIRKSIKLTEAIGLIAKNRYTSIEKQTIRNLLQSAINLNFRELNSFFGLFKNPENQKDIISFIADAVKKEIAKEKSIDDEKCQKIASDFFWGMNFFYVFAIIFKTVQSVGSENLIEFLDDIAKENPTPANQLILEGAKIMYMKNIDKNKLFKYIKDSNYSPVAKSVLRMFVVEHCRMNPTNYSEVQQLSAKMQIPIAKLKK